MNHSHHHDTRPAPHRRGLYRGISVVAGVACVALALTSPSQFWPGYLVAANFWISISLGCLGISLIHAIAGGRWGYALGRGLQSGAATLPLALALGLILIVGAGHVFPWAISEDVRKQVLNHNQQLFLHPQVVLIRYVLMSLFWIGTAFWLRRIYIREAADRSKVPPQGWAGFAMLWLFLTIGCAAVDFQMSLTPGWASSIFPLIRILNCAVSAICVIIFSRMIYTNEPTHHRKDLTHDAGNWLQAFNLLWTYLAFDQFILIWGADLPTEVQYYLDRHTFWGRVGSMALFFLHWLIPFLLLLYRPLKKSYRGLSKVAALVLFMCFVDIAWGTLPSIPGTNALAFLSSVVSIVAIGGFWVAEYSRQYAKLPDMTVPDPHAAHEHGHETHHAGEPA